MEPNVLDTIELNILQLYVYVNATEAKIGYNRKKEKGKPTLFHNIQYCKMKHGLKVGDDDDDEVGDRD